VRPACSPAGRAALARDAPPVPFHRAEPQGCPGRHDDQPGLLLRRLHERQAVARAAAGAVREGHGRAPHARRGAQPVGLPGAADLDGRGEGSRARLSPGSQRAERAPCAAPWPRVPGQRRWSSPCPATRASAASCCAG
jgi:hypothetical protein